MKTLLVTLLSLTLSAAAITAQESNAEFKVKSDGPHLTFENKTHDFGEIAQGDVVNHTFTFKNTGNKPLVLANVKTTCGCTASNWPRDPIAPGESGNIEIKFNSTGKVGRQNKTITIMSNATNNVERISITTNVSVPTSDS